MRIRYKVLLLTLPGLVAAAQLSAQGGCLRQEPCQSVAPQNGFCEVPMMLALTQESPEDQPVHGGGGHGRPEFEQRRKYLEQLRLLKLLEMLDLKVDQETKFVESFRTLRRDMRLVERERATLLQELSGSLEKHQLDDASLDQYTGKLKELDIRRRDRVQQFLGDMKQLLSPEQLGKFILFQERFELELLERVKEFRGRMGQGSGGVNEDKDS